MNGQIMLRMPGRICFGENALDRIPDILSAEGTTHAAVITDKGVRAAGLTDLVLDRIRQAGIGFTVIDDVPPEPTVEQAQEIVDQCGAVGADLLVAVGGGSAMDAAKLASLLVPGRRGHGGKSVALMDATAPMSTSPDDLPLTVDDLLPTVNDLLPADGALPLTGNAPPPAVDALPLTVRDLLDSPGKAKKQVRSVMVPTTAGTGSEATPNAIVAVPEKELKIGIVNEAMVADHVVLDARMIRALPRGIAAATGIDALAHAVECFTSRKANPMSDTFALSALRMILSSIEAACDDPDAMAQKQTMQLASFYAGVAIAASGTTAVHALSYPLGGKYHIAHGVSNAMLLVPVLRFNLGSETFRERLAEAHDACIPGGRTMSCAEKANAMIDRMDEIVKHLDIPTSLRAFHVPESDLDTLVEAGMQVQRLLVNNQRMVTAEDAREIYRQIL